MAFIQTLNDLCDGSKKKPPARIWQVNLVGVRRRDAAHRLCQVYQLLLDLPKTPPQPETPLPTAELTPLKVDRT
jgi:hypothetical protein